MRSRPPQHEHDSVFQNSSVTVFTAREMQLLSPFTKFHPSLINVVQNLTVVPVNWTMKRQSERWKALSLMHIQLFCVLFFLATGRDGSYDDGDKVSWTHF